MPNDGTANLQCGDEEDEEEGDDDLSDDDDRVAALQRFNQRHVYHSAATRGLLSALEEELPPKGRREWATLDTFYCESVREVFSNRLWLEHKSPIGMDEPKPPQRRRRKRRWRLRRLDRLVPAKVARQQQGLLRDGGQPFAPYLRRTGRWRAPASSGCLLATRERRTSRTATRPSAFGCTTASSMARSTITARCSTLAERTHTARCRSS